MLKEQSKFLVKYIEINAMFTNLQLFWWHYVKYANMEGFRRDSHIYALVRLYLSECVSIIIANKNFKFIFSTGINNLDMHSHQHLCDDKIWSVAS